MLGARMTETSHDNDKNFSCQPCSYGNRIKNFIAAFLLLLLPYFCFLASQVGKNQGQKQVKTEYHIHSKKIFLQVFLNINLLNI